MGSAVHAGMGPRGAPRRILGEGDEGDHQYTPHLSCLGCGPGRRVGALTGLAHCCLTPRDESPMRIADDDRLAAFREHRPLLFSIAYRMLGSVADAEDVVQDAYLRWLGADPSAVRSPKDFLATTVTRLAVDHLRSARVRREVY